VKIPWPSGSWRLEVAAAVQEMHYLSKWFYTQTPDPNARALVDAIEAHVKSVQNALRRRLGANPTSILGHMSAARENLLRLAPLSYVRGYLPNIVALSRSVLKSDDPRLTTLDALAGNAKSSEITEDDRETAISCLNGTNEEIRRTQSRLQNFRNVILFTAAFLMFLALAIGLVCFFRPYMIPICFANEQAGVIVVACPTTQSVPFSTPGARIPSDPNDISDAVRETVTPLDILLIEFIGFISAALAAAISIRNVRGSSDPYSIPMALAFLKLPAGALTALLGLVLIRAGLVPGIRTLLTSAEIIAWALLFGYAQQLFTGVVDRQARSVLEESGSSPHSTQTASSLP
jgi:hypothetical protein